MRRPIARRPRRLHAEIGFHSSAADPGSRHRASLLSEKLAAVAPQARAAELEAQRDAIRKRMMTARTDRERTHDDRER